MRTVLLAIVVCIVAVAGSARTTAQSNRQEQNACLADLIQRRIQSQQPLQLSAETITLTGDTLRLSGHARIRSNDIAIRADEALFNQTSKHVELMGNVDAFLGASTPSSLERIRFAVLKLSEGDLTKLLSAVHHAQIDWRDVLVWAGFGSDTRAHLGWWP